MKTAEHMNRMTKLQIAWVAGIMEGEGSFILKEASKFRRERNLPYVKVAMNDEDIIRRLHTFVGFGKVYSGLNPSGTRYFVWQSTNRDLAPKFCRVLRPLMGARRQGQIDTLLAGAAPYGYTSRSVRYSA